MSFYELIEKQFAEFSKPQETDRITYFRKTDVVEYMVLEASGCLDMLQDIPLKCVFRQGYTSNILYEDGELRSGIELGFKSKISRQNERLGVVTRKLQRMSQGDFDFEHKYYNSFGTEYSIILLDSYIEYAIKTSSLYKAAGDLSQFTLEELLELSEKIKYYRLSDDEIAKIVSFFDNKISQHISNSFNEIAIYTATEKVQADLLSQKVIAEQYLRLEKLCGELYKKLNTLIDKGVRCYPLQPQDNPNYVPGYEQVAKAAEQLRPALEKAKTKFFKNKKPTEQDLKNFLNSCHEAINNAKGEFSNHRSDLGREWNKIHFILKGLLGILACISIVPAIIVEVKTKNVWGTFFGSSPTDSANKLALFEKECFEGEASISQALFDNCF
jgi:hypothetical protein